MKLRQAANAMQKGTRNRIKNYMRKEGCERDIKMDINKYVNTDTRTQLNEEAIKTHLQTEMQTEGDRQKYGKEANKK